MSRLKRSGDPNTTIRVLFEPLGRRADVGPGVSILDAASRCGAGIRSDCGGAQSCGKCRVVIEDQRSVSPPGESEKRHLVAGELGRGYRLACAARLLPGARKVTVVIPPESRERRRRFNGSGVERRVRLDPVIMHLDIPNSGAALGLAVDLGTSRITARLVDLDNGSTIDSESIENPQIIHGENLISRASYAQASEENRLGLRSLIVEGVNALIGRLIEGRGEAGDILEAVLVGNTVMHHLFLGLDTTRLTRAPFTPATRDAVWLTGFESRLDVNPRGVVVVLPNIDAFVGADAVADILSSNLTLRAEPTLLVDVGTNTEIMLRAGGETLACSCASGPAFEGEHIEHGVKAVEGAIERVTLREGAVRYSVIGGGEPVGICGSGIVDAVAALLREGLINRVGRFTEEVSPRPTQAGNQKKFIIAPAGESGTGADITISERDINEVILAKAAIAAGTGVLMAMKGIKPSELRRVLVAGAFGSHLDKRSAKTIGLIPPVEGRRIAFLGNAALEGASAALRSRRMLDQATRIAEETRYVELASNPDFDARFRRALLLEGAKRY